MTNPSRPASNGRDARAGSSLRVLIARMMLNAAYVSGASGASAPPASMTSARPSRTAWKASPTAIVPDAQLIAFGPVNPNSMAILQLAAPQNTANASEGSSPRGPSARYRGTWDSANDTPPSAEPIIVPTRSGSSWRGEICASASASPALISPRQEDPDRVGTMMGSALGGVSFAESQVPRYLAEGPRGLDPSLALAV